MVVTWCLTCSDATLNISDLFSLKLAHLLCHSRLLIAATSCQIWIWIICVKRKANRTDRSVWSWVDISPWWHPVRECFLLSSCPRAVLLSFIYISQSLQFITHQTFHPVCVSMVNVPSCSLEVSLSRRRRSSLPSSVLFIWSPLWKDLHPQACLKDSSSDRLSFRFQVVSFGSPDVWRCRCHVPCPWRPWAGCCRPGRRTSCLWRTCCSSRWPGRSPTKVRPQALWFLNENTLKHASCSKQANCRRPSMYCEIIQSKCWIFTFHDVHLNAVSFLDSDYEVKTWTDFVRTGVFFMIAQQQLWNNSIWHFIKKKL